MKTLSLPNTFCGDATPDGSLVALYPEGRPDPRLATSRDYGATFGRVELPGPNVRYPVCDVVQGVLCIGVSALAGDFGYIWNGERWIALKDKDGHPVETYGTSACAFGPYGLYVSCKGTVDNVKVFAPLTGQHTGSYTKAIGASGIALVDGVTVANVHPQDQWYGAYGLGEYIVSGGYVIGQGTVHDGLKVHNFGMLIQNGLCQFNKVARDGARFATTSWLSALGQTEFRWPVVDFSALIPE